MYKDWTVFQHRSHRRTCERRQHSVRWMSTHTQAEHDNSHYLPIMPNKLYIMSLVTFLNAVHADGVAVCGVAGVTSKNTRLDLFTLRNSVLLLQILNSLFKLFMVTPQDCSWRSVQHVYRTYVKAWRQRRGILTCPPMPASGIPLFLAHQCLQHKHVHSCKFNIQNIFVWDFRILFSLTSLQG